MVQYIRSLTSALLLNFGGNDMEMLIGANIRRLRKSKNMTQEQLSEAVNVTCAAVSKWERSETYPDITLLQPLAYCLGVSIDELMGYDEAKIREDIEKIIIQYRDLRTKDWEQAGDLIIRAYHEHPQDHRIMHYYMWHIAGGAADNDPKVLSAHKEEFMSICDKILEGCTDESIRLEAWNMRAKLLYAEGMTKEAVAVYRERFADWYHTSGQKCEQLFVKGTDEYCFYVRKNMYELADLVGDKLGRVIFFDTSLAQADIESKALEYGELFMKAGENESFFVMLAHGFLGRMRNDFIFRVENMKIVTVLTDKYLAATRSLRDMARDDDALHEFLSTSCGQKDFLSQTVEFLTKPDNPRNKRLLSDTGYAAVLKKYASIQT